MKHPPRRHSLACESNQADEQKPRFPRQFPWLALGVAALAASLWLFCYPLLPVAVSPEEPLIPARNVDGKYGYVNTRGQKVIPFQWESAWPFDSDGMAMVEKGNFTGWIDRQGKVVISPQWESPDKDSFAPNLLSQGFDPSGRILVGKNGKYGWIDRAGREIIPLVWVGAEEFGKDNLALVWKDGKCGWINQEGKLVLPLKWDAASNFDSNGLARVQKDQKWGWIGRGGKVALPLGWDDTEDFDQYGLARVKRNGTWGYINREGLIVISLEWEYIGKFDSEGMAAVIKELKYGWINRKGETLLPLEWEEVSDFDAGGLARVQQQGKLGWINREGTMVVPVEWHTINNFDAHGMAAACRQDGKWGYLNRKGELIIPCRFIGATDFGRDERAWVIEDGRLISINRAGAQVKGIASRMEVAMMIRERGGLIMVMSNDGRTGCLDWNGKWLFPLDNWCGMGPEIDISLDNGLNRFQTIYAARERASLFIKSWAWLADKLPLPKTSSPATTYFTFYAVYDNEASRVIYANTDREKEVLWGTGLAVLAAGALFMAWRRRGRRGQRREGEAV